MLVGVPGSAVLQQNGVSAGLSFLDRIADLILASGSLLATWWWHGWPYVAHGGASLEADFSTQVDPG